MLRRNYVLTERAAADLREARTWSRARWGEALTDQYFDDLHNGAQFIAHNHSALKERNTLAGGTSLLLYLVREHYIVYEPLSEQLIAVVAVIRAGRDIPQILQKWALPIRQELAAIRARIALGEIAVSTKAPRKARRKKK